MKTKFEPINFDGKQNRFQKTLFNYNVDKKINVKQIPQPITKIINAIVKVHPKQKQLYSKY